MTETSQNSVSEDKVAPAEPQDEGEADLKNELNEPRWAVIGASDRTVRHLTYEQAIECRNVLDAEGIFGLVIVTDDAAERVLNRQGQA